MSLDDDEYFGNYGCFLDASSVLTNEEYSSKVLFDEEVADGTIMIIEAIWHGSFREMLCHWGMTRYNITCSMYKSK
jgi:hypothetical protein